MEIINAINEVKKKVRVVNKNGKNTFHKYNYATANDVLHEVRDAMIEEGIVAVPIWVSDIHFSKEDCVQNFTQHFRVYCTKDGSFIDTQVRAAGEDKGDKHAYKANTGALKYLYIELFTLPTEDDPENDTKYPHKPEIRKPTINTPAPTKMDSNYHDLFKNCTTLEDIGKVWTDNKDLQANNAFKAAATARKVEVTKQAKAA